MSHPYIKLPRICDYLEYYAQTRPHDDALVMRDIRYTYSDFDQLVNQTAAGLCAAGVRRGDRIACITTPRPEFAVSLMAAMRIGAIWVGINPKYTWNEIDHILQDCKPSFLFSITHDPDGRNYDGILNKCLQQHASLKKIVTFPNKLPGTAECLDDFIRQRSSESPRLEDTKTSNDADAAALTPAVLVYTSGTTGKPKGALLCNDNLIYSFESVSRSFVGKEHLREGMRALCNLPTNHIGCISEILGNTIICGGALIFSERFSPEETLHMIESERITLFGGVPLMLEQIFSHDAVKDTDLSSVKIIGWGGAPATHALVEKMNGLGVHLFTNYGLTEGGAIYSATPPKPSIDILCNTVGSPDPAQEHKIIDEDGSILCNGEVGEVCLRGRGVFLGYWNNSEATEKAVDRDGWLHTGDLIRQRNDGYWVLEGRKSEMFKSGGYNVYPREIENCLEQHNDVATAVVLSEPDSKYFEVGIAFVSHAPGRTLTADNIKDYLRENLASYKVPKTIHLLSKFPMLPIGKVDKSALRKLAAHSQIDKPLV